MPANVDSKEFTKTLNPLEATLTKKEEGYSATPDIK
jgi:hypothetical protein